MGGEIPIRVGDSKRVEELGELHRLVLSPTPGYARSSISRFVRSAISEMLTLW